MFDLAENKWSTVEDMFLLAGWGWWGLEVVV